MNIERKLQEALFVHLEKPYRTWPTWLYLGEDEVKELDKALGGLVFEFCHVEIVMVCRRTFVEYGD